MLTLCRPWHFNYLLVINSPLYTKQAQTVSAVVCYLMETSSVFLHIFKYVIAWCQCSSFNILIYLIWCLLSSSKCFIKLYNLSFVFSMSLNQDLSNIAWCYHSHHHTINLTNPQILQNPKVMQRGGLVISTITSHLSNLPKITQKIQGTSSLFHLQSVIMIPQTTTLMDTG